MSPASRRRLCRSLFLGCVLLPTVLMACWGGWAYTDRQAAEWRTQMEQQVLENLGMAARIERVARRGDQVRLMAVTLLDGETAATVAQVHEISMAPRGAGGWAVHTRYVRIAPGQVPRLIGPLYDRLRHTRGPLEWSGIVTAEYVTAEAPGRQVSFPRIECHMGAGRQGSVAHLQFWLEGVTTRQPLEVRVLRDRRPTPPETVLIVNTHGDAVPVHTLALLVPELAQLGSQCQLSGLLQLRHTGSTWKLEHFTGQCTQVDLYSLVTEHFRHHLLTGIGTVHIEQATFENGRVTQARGRLHAEHGVVSRSLLQAVAKHMQYQLGDTVQESSQERWEYRDLRLDFHVAGGTLRTWGRSGDAGEVLWSGNAWLLRQEQGEVPIVHFIRTLAPESAHQVPATPQTFWLASLLPVPPVQPANDTDQVPWAPPVRLGKRAPDPP